MEILIFIIIVLVVIFFFVKYNKKKLMKRILRGVGLVQMGVCRRLQINYEPVHGSISNYLAIVVTNEIFSKETIKPKAKQFLESNKCLVEEEFSKLSNPSFYDIRIAITRAIRMQSIAHYGLGYNDSSLVYSPIEKLRKAGILIIGLEKDYPDDFINFAEEFYETMEDELIIEGKKYLENKEKYESENNEILKKFINYCSSFLINRCNLSDEQANLLLLDPDLGKVIDKEKHDWLTIDIGLGNDFETYLDNLDFDSSNMKRINRVLSKYANEFPEREHSIMLYLKSIGYFD